jgi:hypothetical protein
MRRSQAMANEHTTAADSFDQFTSANYGVVTTPVAEWWFVAEPHRDIEWPVEQKLRGSPESRNMRKPKPLAELQKSVDRINEQLKAVGETQAFLLVEGFGVRLYTGPMCEPSPAHPPTTTSSSTPSHTHTHEHTDYSLSCRLPAGLSSTMTCSASLGTRSKAARATRM